MRVYELARDLGVDSKEVLERAHELGLDVKTASSGIDAESAELLRLAFAPEEPARRTVEVEAFCSWSACRMKMRSIARASTGLTLYSSQGTAKHICRKLAA